MDLVLSNHFDDRCSGYRSDISRQDPTVPAAPILHIWHSTVARGQAIVLPLGLPLRCVLDRTAFVSVSVETVITCRGARRFGPASQGQG